MEKELKASEEGRKQDLRENDRNWELIASDRVRRKIREATRR